MKQGKKLFLTFAAMQIDSLFNDLIQAYSQENLNSLSSEIISLYRKKDIAALRRIHALIYDGDQGEELPLPRIFSRIIMVYHPDRQEKSIKEMAAYLANGDFERLQSFAHILDIQNIDLSPVDDSWIEDAGFDSEDLWDDSVSGYSYFDDSQEHEADEYDVMEDMVMNKSFFNAVKRKVYGHMNMDFPVHLLADMEIIEMAEYEIEDMEGVEYCSYARIIDLSGNNLTEISRLGMLNYLEEIYVQNNQISYLDGLNQLPFLRILDISNNDIEDISPLFEIDTLEFINAMGNRIPAWQLEKLAREGKIVIA